MTVECFILLDTVPQLCYSMTVTGTKIEFHTTETNPEEDLFAIPETASERNLSTMTNKVRKGQPCPHKIQSSVRCNGPMPLQPSTIDKILSQSFRRRTLAVLSTAVLSNSQAFTASSAKPTTTSTCSSLSMSSSSSLSPTIRVIPSGKLHVSEPNPAWFGNGPNEKLAENPNWTNTNWLKSRFHFSFAEYSNHANSNFGVLRVMNDDLVQPHRGFGTHPHANMEIVTYIVHGALTHQDSTGTKESLGRGSVQFMTAGTGIRHSEFNHGDQPLRFVQTWIVPTRSGLKPNYGSYEGQKEERCNQMKHLVSSVEDPAASAPVKINQDVDAYASELELGRTVSLELGSDQQAYLVCLEGTVAVNGKELQKYDGCEIVGGGPLEITATGVEDTETGQVAHILMFTMKAVPGAGRTDL